MQESKSSGLGASFGGEASESLFGTSTADVLKRFTGWLALIFLVACILLSLWTTALGKSKTTAPAFTMKHLPTQATPLHTIQKILQSLTSQNL